MEEIVNTVNDKSRRRIYKLEKVPKKLLIIFISLYNIHPIIYFLLVSIIIGFENFIDLAKIILIIAPPIIGTGTIVFILMLRKLKRAIQHLLNLDDNFDKERNERFFNRYPFFSTLPLVIGCASGPILTVIIGLYLDIFFSIPQVVFLVLIGETTALAVGFVLYYFSKIYLYPSNRILKYNPLTIFHKFFIPIFVSILLIITFIGVGIYKVAHDETRNLQNSLLKQSIRETGGAIESFFEKVSIEGESYSKVDLIKKMNLNNIELFLKKIQKIRDNNIEMYFISEPGGFSKTSIGKDANVYDRPYFKEVFKTGKKIFSDPVVSRATQKDIIVAAIPVYEKNKIVGLFG